MNEQHIQVYHGLSNELPFNINHFKGKKIVTTHDLIFLRYPKLYPYLDRKIYNKKFRHACDTADTIIAISEETKRDIEEHYFIPENKIKVIYQSCDELYYKELTNEHIQEVKIKHQLPRAIFVVCWHNRRAKKFINYRKGIKSCKRYTVIGSWSEKKLFP